MKSARITAEHAVQRPPPASAAWTLGSAFALSLAAGIFVLSRAATELACVAGITLHVAATVVAASAMNVEPSRRTLAIVLVFTLPVGVGVALATLALATHGRGNVAALRASHVQSVPGAPRASAVADPPQLAALVSRDAEERRSALLALVQRGDADAAETLRWCVRHGEHDLTLEAALALEAVRARKEAHLAACRNDFLRAPSFEAALTAADAAAAPVVSGLADAEPAQALASEARRLYALAGRIDPRRSSLATRKRAAFELDLNRPDAALAALDRAGTSTLPTDDADQAIWTDTALAARRLDRLLTARGGRP